MKYIVIFNEDKIKWFENREDAEIFVEELCNEDLEEYCSDYDIDLDDDISPQRRNELIYGAGAESGEIKIISLNRVLNLIKQSNMSNKEKEELKNELLENEYNSIDYYENLFDIIN